MTSNRKFYKRIPFNFDKCSFYKGFPWEIFFTRKSFVNFFWNFKLESDFFPHFLSKIRKLENSAHLFILNYNWANFQRNRRQKNSSLSRKQVNLQGNSFGKGYVSGTLYSLHSQSKLNYKGNPLEKATFPGRYTHYEDRAGRSR